MAEQDADESERESDNDEQQPDDVHEQIHDVREQVRLLRGTLRQLLDASLRDPDSDLPALALQHRERVELLEERVDQLEHGRDALVTDLPTSKQSKRLKMAVIVDDALDNAATPNGAAINRDRAAGAADCSERHALNLFDDIAEQFAWATKDTDPDQTRLVIDFGGVDEATFRERVENEFAEFAEVRET